MGKATFDDGSDTITVASVVAIPAEYKISMKPEHVDIGRQHFVVLSPIDCTADEEVVDGTPGGSATISPSARTYTFGTATWACDDLTATEAGTNVWALDGTRRRLEGDKYDILTSRQDPHYQV